MSANAYEFIDHTYDVIVVGAGGAGLRATLGLQVVIEDYVHHEATKVASLVLVRLACWALGAAALFAVLRVALGS